MCVVQVLAPDLDGLSSELKTVHGKLREQLSRRGVELAPVEGEAGGNGAEPARVPGDIRSRDDAIRVLDQICEYFRKNEPSSPVPLLLQRAKRLLSKDFMEILRDPRIGPIIPDRVIIQRGDDKEG